VKSEVREHGLIAHLWWCVS